jgi:DNA-directed RNA polymerase specialized sigma24 family protein
VLHLIQDSDDPRGIVGAADFRGDAAVTTWLRRIVVNASLERLPSTTGRGNPRSPGHRGMRTGCLTACQPRR